MRPRNRPPGIQRTELRRVIGVLTAGEKVRLIRVVVVRAAVVIEDVQRQRIVERGAAEIVEGEDDGIGRRNRSSSRATVERVRNPARFLGELPRSGTVEEGRTANLTLLTANPLEDIWNSKKIDAVVLNGKLLTRADPDHLLQDVATKAAAANR